MISSRPIRTIEDIQGKTIAANTLGAHLDDTVPEELNQKGLPHYVSDLVAVPGPQREQVLCSRQVNIAAFGYWQTTFEGAARENGGLRAIFDDTDVRGEIAGGFTARRKDWAAKHPKPPEEFVRQSARALDFARENPEKTRQILANILQERGEDPEVATYCERPGGLATDRDIQFWIDVLERDGKLTEGQLKANDILLVTGTEVADSGQVVIGGAPVIGVGKERAVIYQEPRLLPWLTVLENVALGLELRGITQTAAKDRHYIRLVGWHNFEQAWPRQLSGGMTHRVSVAGP